jgi:spore coat polysaccharide biosynthesis protein SpsF
MLPLAGKPLLTRMVERVLAADLSGTVVVATTTDPADDPIKALCSHERFHCFRGHPTDLLDRHYQVAVEYGADIVVKIPSDCPLIDPTVIDRVIGTFLMQEILPHYVSNLHPPSYPDGNDVEVMAKLALRRAWEEARLEHEREHTTPYIWDHPDLFRILNVVWERGVDYSNTHRWTIDYLEDYQLIEKVYSELYPKNPQFGMDDILELLEKEPEIGMINARYWGVTWYRHYLNQLQTISSLRTYATAEV